MQCIEMTKRVPFFLVRSLMCSLILVVKRLFV